MKLEDLSPAPGSRKREKRIGRGPGSGHGKTSTKGHKGQKARSGGVKGPGFEGGQQPLIRRIPKRGFTSIFKSDYSIVNLDALATVEDSPITPDILKKAGLVKQTRWVKILGKGELSRPITIQAHKFSKSAEEKIIKAGGRIEVL